MLAFAATVRAIVDGKLHLHGRRIDGHKRKCLSFRISRKSFTNIDVLKTCDTNNVTSETFSGFLVGKTTVFKNLAYLTTLRLTLLGEAENTVALFHRATLYFTKCYPADVIIPGNIRCQHFKRRIRIRVRSGDVFNDCLQQGDDILLIIIQ